MEYIPVQMEWLWMLRTCSHLAKALWIDLASLMWQAKPRGYLITTAGQPMSQSNMIRLGYSPEEIQQGLQELLTHGMLEEDPEGIFFCSFLTEAGSLRRKRQAAGRKGAEQRWLAHSQTVSQEISTATREEANSSDVTNSVELPDPEDAQKIGSGAQKNGKHGKCYGKTIAKVMATPLQTECETGILPEGVREDGLVAVAEGANHKINDSQELGSFKAGRFVGQKTFFPPNTPLEEISYGGGETRGMMGVMGDKGGLRGEKGAKREARGAEALPLDPRPSQSPVPQNEATQLPPMGLKLEPIDPPPAQSPVPQNEVAQLPPMGSKLEPSLPKPSPGQTQVQNLEQSIVERWRKLGELWRDGQPYSKRDRRLLWQVAYLSLTGCNGQKLWAQRACQILWEARPRNPGAYLQRLVLELGSHPGEPDVGIVLNGVPVPAWVNHRVRSLSKQPYPLLDLSETEREEARQVIQECMAIVRGAKNARQ